MNPVRGIETCDHKLPVYVATSFKLMNPVRGIETLKIENHKVVADFQINESRSRD